MGQLTCVWRQSIRLSLNTKLRLYNALVVSVLLYGAETWTLTKSDEQKLGAFQMSCLWRILGLTYVGLTLCPAERIGDEPDSAAQHLHQNQ